MKKELENISLINQYVREKVTQKIENHYSDDESILFAEGHNKDIIKVIISEYGDALESLIDSNELEDIYSENRNIFLFGENSINDRIIELIDNKIKEFCISLTEVLFFDS